VNNCKNFPSSNAKYLNKSSKNLKTVELMVVNSLVKWYIVEIYSKGTSQILDQNSILSSKSILRLISNVPDPISRRP